MPTHADLQILAERHHDSSPLEQCPERLSTLALESDAAVAQAWAGMGDAAAALPLEPAGTALERGAPTHDWARAPLVWAAVAEEVPHSAHEWAGPAH